MKELNFCSTPTYLVNNSLIVQWGTFGTDQWITDSKTASLAYPISFNNVFIGTGTPYDGGDILTMIVGKSGFSYWVGERVTSQQIRDRFYAVFIGT